MPSLNGKTVLITGALGTIGRSLVERYGQEGARVIASDLPGRKTPMKRFAVWRRKPAISARI